MLGLKGELTDSRGKPVCTHLQTLLSSVKTVWVSTGLQWLLNSRRHAVETDCSVGGMKCKKRKYWIQCSVGHLADYQRESVSSYIDSMFD